MSDLTHQSDQIVRAAGDSLAHQRAGGRRRGNSVGMASARLKKQHLVKKVVRLFVAVVAILVAAGVAGAILNGIGFYGVMLTVLAMVVAAFVLARYPRLKTPKRADLNTPDVKQLVGRTELWLEHQRDALPAPAASLVNDIGVQLDELQVQLVEVDQNHPTAAQIRKLVGEDLPEMIAGFRRIPQRMRDEQSNGTTPARQLEEGLRVIGSELDSINRQLAQGSLDDLAIRGRYLEYKYGTAMDTDSGMALGDQGAGVPLPAFDKQGSKS